MPGQKYYLMHSPRESNFILVKLYPFEPVIWCSSCLYDRPWICKVQQSTSFRYGVIRLMVISVECGLLDIIIF